MHSDAEAGLRSPADTVLTDTAEVATAANAEPEQVEPEQVEQVELEQGHLSLLYRHLDLMREQAGRQLRQATAAPTVGTPGARSERDAFVRLYAARVSQLQAVEERLCFGRLDLAEGIRRYIGRVGIAGDDREELLVDWRAPAAEAFYQATAAHPSGVLRRRQIATADRRVTGLQDEVLDLEGFGAVFGEDEVVLGEGALFASLNASRTGRMRDIVATIQGDQDRAIRAPLAGVLVVQGGPGTGKTAVALHRTAFLLYANRERISRSGVLLVGPNRVFLRYIEQVLPALGESESVLMCTPGELFPGVRADRHDEPRLAAVKSDLRMVGVIREAVRRRQRLIDAPVPLDVEGTRVFLQPDDVRAARDKARRSRDRHNQARETFVKELLRVLVRALAAARDVELDADTRTSYLEELRAARDVRREINLLWPPISPQRLLRDLYADGSRLAEAGRELTLAERGLLRRERPEPWSVQDVPLLDEAAELLGPDDSTLHADQSAAIAAVERRAEVEYARSVQETFGGQDFITAEDLAARYAQTTTLASVAERAAADREWNFGHIVVDEAQELSPMMWRLLMRRSSARSMTLVGDVAQTSALTGATSWGAMLAPHVGQRWNLAELTVNYRTPGQIMDVAAAVMAAAGIPAGVPTSARRTEAAVAYTAVASSAATASEVASVVAAERAQVGEGIVAVITSRARHGEVVTAVRSVLGSELVTADTSALGSAVSVLTVADAKGLEFDAVVIVEPAEIVAESPRGINDLYVALTRPTQRLHVLHSEALPAGM